MRHLVRVGNIFVSASLAGVPASRLLLIDDPDTGDASFAVAMRDLGGNAVAVTVGGDETELIIAGDKAGYFIHCDGEVYEVAVLDPLAVHGMAAGRQAGLQGFAPMPGNVVAVPVAVGDVVRAGDTLVVLESMKLEVALRAEAEAVVAEINCAVGQGFEKGALLVRLSALGAAAE